MTRHANPRLYIGPKTNEIIVSLGRSFGVLMNDTKPDVHITFKRRKCGDQPSSDWLSYVVDSSDNAHFEVPLEFVNEPDEFPRGFYDGKVYVGECHVADIELIKAPGHYVNRAKSISDKCHGGTEWVEPDCNEDSSTICGCSCKGDPEEYCDCIYKVKNNCPTCYNETFVSKVSLIEGYTDWEEKELPPEAQPSELDEVKCKGVDTVKPIITRVQESNLPEGYIEDDNC